MNNRWAVLDLVLIVASVSLAFTQPWLLGGWGWFLLLGLSPNAHRN